MRHLLAVLLIIPALVHADYIEELVSAADSAGLHENRAWHALVHYKSGGLLGGWESQADDTAFFLDVYGKTDPRAELLSTIRAMDIEVEDMDQHPRCRFPARYHWLDQQLGFDEGRLRPVSCKEFDEWMDTIRPGSLTLVFPAAYINSPSSMFGHTLLRVNPEDHRKDSPLAAYALNYAADANASDNALVFTYKGLFGGYPGSFSIVPYYEKIKEYSDIENRDIWEYELDIDREELQQMMRHVWELKSIRFDYYFLTENCSYHVLTLLESARPTLDLTSGFDVKAIPSDTVRVVIDADLVTEFSYRPSLTTIISQRAEQMGQAENKQVHRIVTAGASEQLPSPDEFTDIDRARIFEQSYDYSRFLSTADPTVRDARARSNWLLLSERSKIDTAGSLWDEIVEPDVRTENGHSTGRLAIAPGRLDDENYVELKYRPAYHDVVDPPEGYTEGAQINFLDLSVRYYTDREKVRLDKFTILNILSLTPSDQYFDHLSWGIDVAVEQHPSQSGPLHAAQLMLDGGLSKRMHGVIVSALAEVQLRGSDDYDKGYTIGTGVKANLLLQSGAQSLQTSIRALPFRGGEESLHQSFDLEWALHLDRDSSLRLTFERSLDYQTYSTDSKLAYHLYF